MIAKLVFVVLFLVVGAYFLGCFNGALLISKYILRDDVRNHGSGNAGLTNFYRTFGSKLAAVVILCDVLKTVIAVVAGGLIFGILMGNPLLGKYLGGFSCMLGHMYPCMFSFKGGKGVLSGGVIALFLDWRIALAVWGSFLLLLVLSRMVSLGSITGGTAFSVASVLVYADPVVWALAVVMGFFVVWQHRSNIVRILRGEENKLKLRKEKKEDRQ